MIADVVDKLLEGPIVPSFTKIGPAVRRRLDDWDDLSRYDLSGRVIFVTGSSSGLGKCAAARLAGLGATVIVNSRSEDTAAEVGEELAREIGAAEPLPHLAGDVGDLDQARAMAEELLGRYDRLDALVHNAGALTKERHESPQGLEQTVSAQVVGPFLLTHLLLDRLREASPGRVITMTSGGMYASPLHVDRLPMDEASYNGTEQYARAKRAQVALCGEWARRHPDTSRIVFHTVHPGWAATPGVTDSLPGFDKVMGPLLRSAEEGSDTLVWLAAADGEPTERTGELWLDRRTRSEHRLPTTSRSDTRERRDRLWNWVSKKAGLV